MLVKTVEFQADNAVRHNPIPFSVLFGCISAFNKFPHSLFASGSQRFTAIRDEEEERLTVEASHNADREMRHLALEHAIEGIGQISTGDALELLQGGSSPGRHARRSTSTVSSRNSHRLAATRCARRGPSAHTHGPANSICLDPAQSSIFVTRSVRDMTIRFLQRALQEYRVEPRHKATWRRVSISLGRNAVAKFD